MPNMIPLKRVKCAPESVKCPLSCVLKFACVAITERYLYQKSDGNGQFLKTET